MGHQAHTKNIKYANVVKLMADIIAFKTLRWNTGRHVVRKPGYLNLRFPLVLENGAMQLPRQENDILALSSALRPDSTHLCRKTAISKPLQSSTQD